jgi:hypothetical protein
MIFDAVQSQRSVIKVSSYDTNNTCDKIVKGSLSVLEGESLRWTISDPTVTSATITVDFLDPIYFDNLLFGFSIPVKVKCMYSYDGYSWNEFNYFQYVVASYDMVDAQGHVNFANEIERSVIASYAGKTFKVDYVPTQSGVHKHYTMYTPLNGKATPVSTDDYQILSSYLDQSFTSAGNIQSQYVFRVVDLPSSTDECIFENLVPYHIQLRLSDFNTTVAPLALTQFQILTSTTINIDETYLSAYAGSMYTQKFFEEYPFEPSIITSFLQMMESSDLEIQKNPQDITLDFHIDEANATVNLVITPELQLGEYFSPVYIWTAGPPTASQKFVYTSIPSDGVWADVNAYIAKITDISGVISKVTDLSLDFMIYTTQFVVNRTIVYDLKKPHTGTGWLTQ